MRAVIFMSLVLLLRALCAPGLDVACLESLTSCAASGPVAISASDGSCCAGDDGCACCIGAPARVPAHEPTVPSTGDSPLRALVALRVDPGVLTVPGPEIVEPRPVCPHATGDASEHRPVARDAAAVLCVWRT